MSRSPTTPALLRLTAVLLPLALVACASAPKKSASEAVAVPDNGSVHGAPLAHGKKKSPYAPAQEDPQQARRLHRRRPVSAGPVRQHA